jgi:hypothetical protein
MVFESPALQGLNATERASVVEQLANLLLQTAGVQVEGVHHDER